jgi:hypothetical protein
MMSAFTFRLLAGALAILLIFGCGEVSPASSTNDGASTVTSETTSIHASPFSPLSALCGMTGYALYPDVSGIDESAWASEQIVVGTVTKQLPSEWSDPLTVGMEKQTGGVSRSIRTDYVVRVESRLRGVPTDTITVATEGGTIGDCTIRNPDSGTLAVGDHVMLFLTRPEAMRRARAAGETTAYVLVSGQSGILSVLDAETVAPIVDPTDRHPYRELATEILAALHTGSPPADMSLPAVSLNDAPAAATVAPLSGQ